MKRGMILFEEVKKSIINAHYDDKTEDLLCLCVEKCKKVTGKNDCELIANFTECMHKEKSLNVWTEKNK